MCHQKTSNKNNDNQRCSPPRESLGRPLGGSNNYSNMTCLPVTWRLYLVVWIVLLFCRAATRGRCWRGSERQGLYALQCIVFNWSTKVQQSKQGTGIIGMKSGDKMLRLFPGALSLFQAIHTGKYPWPMRLAIASSATPEAVLITKAAMDFLEIVPGRLCRRFWVCGWQSE